MITVAGEALIDLIVDPAGHIDPRFGGGPFNVVRAVARLGLPSAFLGRLSSDRFGRLMREDLDRHGVLAAIEAPSDAPTTLAMVDVDPAASPATASTWPRRRRPRSGPSRPSCPVAPPPCTSAVSA